MPTSRRRTTGALALVAALAASSAAALIEVPVSATAAPARAQSAALTASTVGGPELASTGVVVHLGPGATKLPPIHATTWLIADLTTGEVMAAKNAHKQMLPASTLKTLSVVSLMPRLDKNRVITATSREAGQIGSRVGLVSGATYTIWDLWNALLLPSANDAAMALADAYGGPAPTLALMKSEAKRLGAFDTTPRSPSGLDTPGQYSSAYDMALIARAAMQIPDFRTITMTTYYQFPGAMPKPGHKRSTYQLYTENRLLRHHYKGVAGGKTGYTTLARRTFWGAANRNGHLLVVTMFHIDDLTEVAATKLLDWGFANVGKVRPVGTLVQPAAADTVTAPSSTGSTGAKSANTGAATTTASVAATAAAAHSSSKLGLAAGFALLLAAVGGFWWWRGRQVAPAGGHATSTGTTAAMDPVATFVPTPSTNTRAAAAPPAHDDTAPIPIVTPTHVRVVQPPSRPDA